MVGRFWTMLALGQVAFLPRRAYSDSKYLQTLAGLCPPRGNCPPRRAVKAARKAARSQSDSSEMDLGALPAGGLAVKTGGL
jgi:hypothetical protein